MTLFGILVTAGAIGIGYFLVARRLLTVTVNGESMTPTFPPEMDALVRRTTKASNDDVVIVAAPDPLTGWLEADERARLTKNNRTSAHWWIKRVAATTGETIPDSTEVVPEGHYYLLSDNPAGEDSRKHGTVPAHQVLGTVVHAWSNDE
ncbi:S26 family signal peptidase [Haloglycomyces albus]|uniref:S26 family signal peptidase n=1 Tax=Haloglycomyces albus TaxID=526067 RepID=UPI00046D7562|nr:S26 family signal peptidase [Haloglycomyces albus]